MNLKDPPLPRAPLSDRRVNEALSAEATKMIAPPKRFAGGKLKRRT